MTYQECYKTQIYLAAPYLCCWNVCS